jgi:hypothetical protein
MVYVIQAALEQQDQDGTAVPSWSCCSKAVYKPVWRIPLLSVQWITPDDGQRNCPKHVEFHFQIKIWEIGASICFYHKDINKILFCKQRMSRDCWCSAEIRTAYIFEYFFQWLKNENLDSTSITQAHFLTTRFRTHHPPTTLPSTWRSQRRYTMQSTKASDGPYLLIMCLCALKIVTKRSKRQILRTKTRYQLF